MARRKRSNIGEVLSSAVGITFVAAIFLAHGDLQKLKYWLWLIWIVLPAAVVFGLVGFVFWIILRTSKGEESRENIPAPISDTAFRAYRSTPDKNFAPPAYLETQEFTLELLKKLEWRRFELVVEGLFRALGKNPRRVSAGADGGIDLILQENEYGPTSLVQCKAWNVYAVSVKPIREFLE